MKHVFTALFIVLTLSAFGQKKEKIKGSKIIKTSMVEIAAFEGLVIDNRLEVQLIKDTRTVLEIEADDNLHTVIKADVQAKILRLYLTNEVSGYKKMALKIHYTDDLKQITLKEKAELTAFADLQMPTLQLTCQDEAKAFLNIKSKEVTINQMDNSKSELNIKAEVTHITVKNNSDCKALISSQETNVEVTDKAFINLEGEAIVGKIQVNKNANLKAKNFVISEVELISENYANIGINVAKKGTFSMSGRSEIQLWGEPELLLKQFTNSATLYKKEK